MKTFSLCLRCVYIYISLIATYSFIQSKIGKYVHDVGSKEVEKEGLS